MVVPVAGGFGATLGRRAIALPRPYDAPVIATSGSAAEGTAAYPGATASTPSASAEANKEDTPRAREVMWVSSAKATRT
jgi:hypothetical protein